MKMINAVPRLGIADKGGGEFMTTAAKTHRAPRGGDANVFGTIGGAGAMASMAAASQAYIDVIGQCQGEVCDFLTRRLSSDLKLGEDLAKCKDLTEAASLQQEWLRRTVEDYVSEGQKLWQLGTRAAASIRAE
jgi:hypothetical protein